MRPLRESNGTEGTQGMEKYHTRACLLALRMTGGLLVEPEPDLRPNGSFRPTAPSIEGITTDGIPFRLQLHRGQPVILHFWESWCRPCRESLAVVATASRRHPDVMFMGVSSETADRIDAARIAAESVVPCLVDRHRSIVRRYGISAIPTIIVIDPGGMHWRDSDY